MVTCALRLYFLGKKDPEKDAFNLYLSQLRIRIEQTFGLITNKWRILRQPLQMEKDAFNFYLSQLRIRIEQTFGLMTNKWRILRQPLQMEKDAFIFYLSQLRLV